MGIAVVTGASAGIGRATALAFASEGFDVGLISRNEERLRRLSAELEQLGRRALVLPFDVADASAVSRTSRPGFFAGETPFLWRGPCGHSSTGSSTTRSGNAA